MRKEKKMSIRKNNFWSVALWYSTPFLVLSLIWLLALKPTVFYDTMYQMLQVFGTIPYDKIHPVAHTLLLKSFSLGTQNYWFTIYFCVLAQILALSALIGVSFAFFERQGASRKWLRYISFLYICSFRNFSYVNNPWKDPPYTICIFALIFCIYVCERKGIVRKKDAVLMGILITFIALFRHNGILVAVGMLVILAIIYRKPAANVLIMVSMFAAVYGGMWLISNVGLKAEKSTVDHVTYAFSKPVMAVVAQDGNITQEQLAFIEENILPIDVIKQHYSPYSFTDFIWISYGIDAELRPGEFKDARDGYNTIFMDNIHLYKAEVRAMFWDLLPKNTWLMVKDMVQTRRFVYAIWVNPAKDDPAVNYNFSILFEHGFYLISTIIIMYIIVHKHKGRRLTYIAMFAPVLLNVASLVIALAPEVRYVWPTFVMFPFYLGMFLVSREENLNKI